MELAVKAMTDSVVETRADQKISPRVGAVIEKPDGKVEIGCRGELRDGDHAEYTLMERKNRDCKLDGSRLFTTLEPCAPGARNPPKMSCAERIVLARIKQVWVGIEDPDPTVDRKGIRYLQEHGVDVQLFDPDLQERIRAENKDFIAQALARASAAREGDYPAAPKLSPLEKPIESTDFADLSSPALSRYRELAEISEEIDSESFKRRLAQQGVLKEEGGKFLPTGFGLLLFGSQPRSAIPQAGLLSTIRYPDGTEETHDFDGPMVFIPGEVEEWLQSRLPNTIDRSRMERVKRPPLPFELVRESVVNALVHRDYAISGAKCQLIVTSDTIEVRSPGGALPPITLEKLQSFEAPTLSRNPTLHYVLSRMKLAEERGLGMSTFKSFPRKFGLPRPRYSFESPYLVLTLYRDPESATRALPPTLLAKLSEDERAAWSVASTDATVTSAVLERELSFDERKAQRVLKKLVEVKLLRRVGKGRSTRYEVLGA